MGSSRHKGVTPRMLALLSKAAFMRQKQLEVERVLLGAARDSSGKGLSTKAVSWAGRIWDRAVPTLREVPQVGNAMREPVDPGPKVFPNEVARATGRLLRWDDKSRNSARSAVPWAARVADSGAQTLCPAE